MTDTAPALAPPPPELDRQLAALAPCEIVVGLPTYNNAATVPAIVAAVRAGLAAHFTGASAALVNVDAGSTDRTPELLAEAGMPCVLARHEAVAQQVGGRVYPSEMRRWLAFLDSGAEGYLARYTASLA